MGSIARLFGGGDKQSSQSTQTSYNKAYEPILQALSPALGYTTQGGNFLSQLLGLSGGADRDAAFETFRSTPGYQFQLDEGRNAILGSNASRGLLNSGATAKALTKYGQGLADSTYQNYINNLLGFTNIGSDAAKTIVGAGNYSEGQSQSKGGSHKGIGGMVGSILGSIL